MTAFSSRRLTLSTFVVLPLVLASVGCSPGGTQAHDMSAEQHQAAAQQEESRAAEHAAQHDPNASEAQGTRCSIGKGRVCWTRAVNPTQEHASTAEDHRELAAKHRAASQALRDAEASACIGMSEEHRDTSPFAHTADIRSV